MRKETSINVRALRRPCREDILTRERRGWRVRKKMGWLERAQLFVLRCSHGRLELMLGQPDHKPEREGVSCISVGPMISSSPAMQLIQLVYRAWKGFGANRLVTFCPEPTPLRFSLGFTFDPPGHSQQAAVRAQADLAFFDLFLSVRVFGGVDCPSN